ncbi:MAG: hypothetical protein M3Z85_05345, partial [Acidobacteriota bacterium]|nr:hypothetical protein [Acidobacteriota bacterium]
MRYLCLAALLVFDLASPVLAATDISLPSGVTVAPGQQVTFPVTLAQAAPSDGIFVTLTSSDTAVLTVRPASVYIPAGQTTTVSYSVQLIAGNSVGVATVTASAANLTGDTETVYVGTAPPAPSIKLPSGVTVAPGQQVAFAVVLSAPAPTGGVTVALASSDTTKAMISPGSISIAAGSTSPAVQPQLTGVAAGSAFIGATAPGYTPASQTVLVQAIPPAALSFAPPNLTIPGAGTGSLQLNLSVAAPAGGLTASLSSSNSGAVTVPSTVTFAANASSVTVAVTGVAPGSATISANAPNVTGA